MVHEYNHFFAPTSRIILISRLREMMVIRMVFEIKKTAMKINKATPIKPQFRMKVPRANKRWVSTPPSLTSETPFNFF